MLSAAILLGTLRGKIIVVNYDISTLIISGPSEVEIARENEVKRGITEAVSKALKAVQKENINTEDRAVYRSVTIQFWFKQYFICILIQNLQTYQYIVTYILGTQMGFRRKSIDFCESVSHTSNVILQ